MSGGGSAKLLLVMMAVIAIVVVSGVMRIANWHEHVVWCQAHSHEMPAKRAPGDTMGPVWSPEDCP